MTGIRFRNSKLVPVVLFAGLSMLILATGPVFWTHDFRFSLDWHALLLGIGLVPALGFMKSFTGGNEAEWTQYLESMLQTERNQLNAVLSTLEEGVAIIGQDRIIQFMNPSLIREFGEGQDELCHRHFYGLEKPCSNCRLPAVIFGKTERWEHSFENGNTFDIVYAPFVNADQTNCVLAAFTNVTKRKQYELELVRLNDLKTELLTRKTEQLQDISREVAKLEDEKKRFVRFLGVVAHDLKSPLSVSQSILAGILGGFYGSVNEGQQDMIDRVIKRIENLNSLIDDLIDIPLIETGQLVRDMTPISLRDVIKASVKEYNVLAAEKGLQLALTLPQNISRVYGSGRRIQQVLNNLLSNALKYSEHGVILVRVSENSQNVKVEVSDYGIGIPPEDMPRLFEDFLRGGNTAGTKGTGLGLSISKRIIEAHGGKIWAESPNPETNSGSRFTFTLPRYSEENETSSLE